MQPRESSVFKEIFTIRMNPGERLCSGGTRAPHGRRRGKNYDRPNPRSLTGEILFSYNNEHEEILGRGGHLYLRTDFSCHRKSASDFACNS